MVWPFFPAHRHLPRDILDKHFDGLNAVVVRRAQAFSQARSGTYQSALGREEKEWTRGVEGKGEDL
jgi:hypothetical protein